MPADTPRARLAHAAHLTGVDGLISVSLGDLRAVLAELGATEAERDALAARVTAQRRRNRWLRRELCLAQQQVAAQRTHAAQLTAILMQPARERHLQRRLEQADAALATAGPAGGGGREGQGGC